MGKKSPMNRFFSTVNERLEEIPESVVFLDISGDSGSVLSFSEIEEYVLSKGALVVAKVNDSRTKGGVPEEVVKVAFSDPDRAVAEEIRRMSLNDGGLIIDEVIRNPDVPRSRVDEETENRLIGLIETIDFKDPDFMIKIPVSPVIPVSSTSPAGLISSTTIGESEGNEPAGTAEQFETLEPVGGTEFAAAVSGKYETPKAFPRIQRSESLNESLNKGLEASDKVPESSDIISESSNSISESPDESSESPHVSIVCENTESTETAELSETVGSAEASAVARISGVTLNSEVTIDPQSNFSANSQASSLAEVPSVPEISQEISGTPVEIQSEDSEERAVLGKDPGDKTKTEAGKLSGLGVEVSSVNEEGDKTEKLPDEKPADIKADIKLPDEKPVKAPDKAAKPVKQSQKKRKRKICRTQTVQPW